MAKHVLVFAHGMGLHGDDWVSGDNGAVETLKSVAKRYAFFQKKPLDNYVQFEPISYDAIFQNIVGQWQNDAAAVAALPGNTLGSATSWLTGAAETEKNFWWTHVADVALYRCFPTYRQMVRAHVMNDIATKIAPAVSAGTNVSILAHSLGTAVVHDTLHIMGSKTTLNGNQNALRATNFRFNNIFMVANVSRLLQSQDGDTAPVYKSVVRPGVNADPASYCQRFLNFRHEADPFAFPRMFDPVDFPADRFRNVLVRHYWKANIHDVSHYLLNPRVHIPILRALTKEGAVTLEEEKFAVNPDNFPQIGGNFSFVQKVMNLASRLNDLQLKLGEDPANGVMTEAFTQYASAVQEAA